MDGDTERGGEEGRASIDREWVGTRCDHTDNAMTSTDADSDPDSDHDDTSLLRPRTEDAFDLAFEPSVLAGRLTACLRSRAARVCVMLFWATMALLGAMTHRRFLLSLAFVVEPIAGTPSSNAMEAFATHFPLEAAIQNSAAMALVLVGRADMEPLVAFTNRSTCEVSLGVAPPSLSGGRLQVDLGCVSVGGGTGGGTPVGMGCITKRDLHNQLRRALLESSPGGPAFCRPSIDLGPLAPELKKLCLALPMILTHETFDATWTKVLRAFPLLPDRCPVPVSGTDTWIGLSASLRKSVVEAVGEAACRVDVTSLDAIPPQQFSPSGSGGFGGESGLKLNLRTKALVPPGEFWEAGAKSLLSRDRRRAISIYELADCNGAPLGGARDRNVQRFNLALSKAVREANRKYGGEMVVELISKSAIMDAVANDLETVSLLAVLLSVPLAMLISWVGLL